MRMVKNACILLLAVGVLVLCICLPKAMAQFRDASAAQKVYYLNTDEIQLPQEETSETLSDTEKLALLCKSRLEVTEHYTKLREEEVRKKVALGLKPYAEHHLIPENFEDFSVFCLPFVCYSETEPEKKNIIWEVSLHYDDAEHWQNLGVLMDDQTGTIFRINFSSEGFFKDTYVSAIVSELASVYENSMDSMELLMRETSRSCGDGSASICYTVYDLDDQLCKAGEIKFYMDDNGFSTKIEMMQP